MMFEMFGNKYLENGTGNVSGKNVKRFCHGIWKAQVP